MLSLVWSLLRDRSGKSTVFYISILPHLTTARIRYCSFFVSLPLPRPLPLRDQTLRFLLLFAMLLCSARSDLNPTRLLSLALAYTISISSLSLCLSRSVYLSRYLSLSRSLSCFRYATQRLWYIYMRCAVLNRATVCRGGLSRRRGPDGEAHERHGGPGCTVFAGD